MDAAWRKNGFSAPKSQLEIAIIDAIASNFPSHPEIAVWHGRALTNPGTTPSTILAVNSDHGLSCAGEETRTMLSEFPFLYSAAAFWGFSRGGFPENACIEGAISERNFCGICRRKSPQNTEKHKTKLCAEVPERPLPKDPFFSAADLQIYSTFEFWRFKFSLVWVLFWVSSFYGEGGGSRTVKALSPKYAILGSVMAIAVADIARLPKGPFRTKNTTPLNSVVFYYGRSFLLL